MKNTIIIIILLVIVGGGIYWYTANQGMAPEIEDITNGTEDNLDNGRASSTPNSTSTSTVDGKLKAEVFTGKLTEVNPGCYVDGECYVVVGGKHVTVVMGWSQETVGSVQGVPSFGDLEGHIGKDVEVYAQVKPDGTYTLYGSEGFYVKAK